MKHWFSVLTLLGLSVTNTYAQTWEITPEFWQMPRSANSVSHDPQLQAAVANYLRAPNSKMRVHYQKRDEANAWAEELRGWLIALGIEADRIELVDDNPAALLKLEVTDKP